MTIIVITVNKEFKMKQCFKNSTLAMGVLFSALLLNAPKAFAEVPLSFTHHGVLKEDGALVNGLRNITATIYDDSDNIVGSKKADIEVNGGLYVMTIDNLDLAAVVASNSLILKVKVDGEELSPALNVTAVPYALAAKHAESTNSVVCKGCITRG